MLRMPDSCRQKLYLWRRPDGQQRGDAEFRRRLDPQTNRVALFAFGATITGRRRRRGVVMASVLAKKLAMLTTGVRRFFLPFVMAMTPNGELRVQHRGDKQEGDKETHDVTLRLSGRPVKPEDFT